MKTKKIYQSALSLRCIAAAVVAVLLLLTSCDNKDYSKTSPFENAVYIDAATTKSIANFTFTRMLESEQKEIAAVLPYPAKEDIEVSFKVDPSLTEHYNARLGTNYSLLDAKHYKLSSQKVIIPNGEFKSKAIKIDFSGLTDLEIDAGFLLPISIEEVSGDMTILEGSKTICYIVRRSSAITTAVNASGNYFEVPGFAAESPTADIVNGLKQLTFEAIVRVKKFSEEITSIMGIEQYCLFRFGDSGFPKQQLQFAANEIKFPKPDNSKLLQAGEWYHLAVCYDTENKTAIVYVDGKEQSRIEDYGNGIPIDLGKQRPGKDFMFKIAHSYGEPDDMTRQLDGDICEVRVWSVVRTQEEIYKNMYSVEPNSPGLCAYWKFNEGKGDIAKDYSGNGNDAVAHYKAVWPDGIEVPQKNKE